MWDLNPRGLSTTDLAGLPHTRLGESRMTLSEDVIHNTVVAFLSFAQSHRGDNACLSFCVSIILFMHNVHIQLAVEN
jgi:hypothetical protein